jgi:hypothetical protein
MGKTWSKLVRRQGGLSVPVGEILKKYTIRFTFPILFNEIVCKYGNSYTIFIGQQRHLGVMDTILVSHCRYVTRKVWQTLKKCLREWVSFLVASVFNAHNRHCRQSWNLS